MSKLFDQPDDEKLISQSLTKISSSELNAKVALKVSKSMKVRLLLAQLSVHGACSQYRFITFHSNSTMLLITVYLSELYKKNCLKLKILKYWSEFNGYFREASYTQYFLLYF